MESCQKPIDKHQFSETDGQNLALSKDQCDAVFPGLFKEIYGIVKRRQGQKITFKELEQQKLKESFGYTRAMIYDNCVCSADDPTLSDRHAWTNTKRVSYISLTQTAASTPAISRHSILSI